MHACTLNWKWPRSQRVAVHLKGKSYLSGFPHTCTFDSISVTKIPRKAGLPAKNNKHPVERPLDFLQTQWFPAQPGNFMQTHRLQPTVFTGPLGYSDAASSLRTTALSCSKFKKQNKTGLICKQTLLCDCRSVLQCMWFATLFPLLLKH